jgi:thymidylate kinase
MERGKLISLEGIDGVGKTSCAPIICEKFSMDGKKYLYINRKAIPSSNEYIKLHMEYLYAILWGDGAVCSKAPNVAFNGLNREHWRHLMIAWYCAFEQHMILPLLEEGISIITDGYVYKEIVKAIHSTGDLDTEKQFDFLYKPDIVFYLTASPKDCIRDDSYTNRAESGMFVGMQSDFVKHQNSMKLIYDKLAVNKNWITIIRNKDVNITCNDIIKAYKEFLT